MQLFANSADSPFMAEEMRQGQQAGIAIGSDYNSDDEAITFSTLPLEYYYIRVGSNSHLAFIPSAHLMM